MTDNSDLRKVLKGIRDDPKLTPAEKSRKSQEAMMRKSTIPKAAAPSLVNECVKTCAHYDKKCSNFFFECCQVIDPCHRCHMARESCDTKPPAISSIMCNSCELRQPPSKTCSGCYLEFSHSYCDICKIWTALDIHHCEGCGFCRVGKSEDIFHCDFCEACFSRNSEADHVCAKTKLKGERCPLCLESVHSSTKSSTILNCGHVVHVDCWKSSYQGGDYRCPTCRKSLFNMQAYWDEIRLSISIQPIPSNFFPIQPGDTVRSPMGPFVVHSVSSLSLPIPAPQQNPATPSPRPVNLCSGELPQWTLAQGQPANATFLQTCLVKDTSVHVLCYDCSERSQTAFHFLGLECKQCGSFNTSRI